MSPDIKQAILEALRAGKSCREVEADFGVGRSSVHRIAQAHGIVNGTVKKAKAERKAREKKPRAVGQRDDGTASVPSGTVGQREVSQESKPRAPDDSPTIHERLELHTKVATKGATACARMVDRGEKILSSGTTDSSLLHAVAAMIAKGMSALEVANRIIRLNAGLPTSYEKGDTTTHGDMRLEHVNPEQIRESASEAFGVRLGRLAIDPVPMAESVDN